MDEKEQVYAKLDELKIGYTKKDHPAAHTIEAIVEQGIDPEGYVAKNLFLRNDSGKQHYLVVIRQDKTADLKDVRRQLGSSRLSFGSEERLMKCLGLKKGSVSPMGVLNDPNAAVIVAFDEDLMGQELLGVHPNDNTATVFLKPAEMRRIIEQNGNEFRLIKI